MGKKNRQGESRAGEAPASFEDRLAELEEIVRQLEAGEKPLEQSIELYERGEKVRAECLRILGQFEKRIKVLKRDAQDGLHEEEIEDPGDEEGGAEEPERLAQALAERAGNEAPAPERGRTPQPQGPREGPGPGARGKGARKAPETDELDQADEEVSLF